MLFLVITRDKPNHLAVRLANRQAHLDHLRSAGSVRLAGPTLDAEGNPDGSMLIVEADGIEAVEDMIDDDPYTKAGLFEHVAIAPWRQALPDPALPGPGA